MLYCTGLSHSLTHVTGGKTEAPEGSLDSLALVSHTIASVTWISPQVPGSTCSPVTSSPWEPGLHKGLVSGSLE